MEMNRIRIGLTLSEIRRVTGRVWLPFSPQDHYDGPGAYIWVGDQGEDVYPGQSKHVVTRLRDELLWSDDGDFLGQAACARLIASYSAIAFYTPTATEEEARDVEALIGAACVHVTGHPPLGWGLAWLPRTPRQREAWETALRWAERESGGQAAYRQMGQRQQLNQITRGGVRDAQAGKPVPGEHD